MRTGLSAAGYDALWENSTSPQRHCCWDGGGKMCHLEAQSDNGEMYYHPPAAPCRLQGSLRKSVMLRIGSTASILASGVEVSQHFHC
jgi:hypothetical protein